ncbi:MAG: RidA family protein [Actinobacteria bacterium]|nr:MAG: RidA family protein [Actinomycetota bacterium]
MSEDRRRVSSGSPYEATIGFSRAVRIGDRVVVSGTAPIMPDGSVDPDPAAQAHRCFEIVARALAEAGASVADVVRTRIYLVDRGDATAIGTVHGTVFGDVRRGRRAVSAARCRGPREPLR